MITSKSTPQILPPPDPPGLTKWIKDNLFGNLFNSILSIISVVILYFLITPTIVWISTEANWAPITESPLLYIIGQYPRDQMWRIGVSIALFSSLISISAGNWGGLLAKINIAGGALFAIASLLPVTHNQLDLPMRLFLGGTAILIIVSYFIGKLAFIKPNFILSFWLITPILSLILFAGFRDSTFLPEVQTTAWGGLMVTFILAVGGIALSFPLGIALAMGRRSDLPMVKLFSTIIIESIRGVPLITILFMFSVILALFLPQGSRIDRLLRALIAFTIFSSAYMAENIRGGLQAVEGGQIEAAKALGMNGFQTNIFIVLPQAIRMVIPAIVGQFISLFKDTTLVVIVGINDLLGIGKAIINSKPEFVHLNTEVYIFIAVIYWIFSYLMSLASRRVEDLMGVGK